MYEQLILFGAPGTGKSYEIKDRLSAYGDDKKFRVTIHPEFLYTDFVGQLLPRTQRQEHQPHLLLKRDLLPRR